MLYLKMYLGPNSNAILAKKRNTGMGRALGAQEAATVVVVVVQHQGATSSGTVAFEPSPVGGETASSRGRTRSQNSCASVAGLQDDATMALRPQAGDIVLSRGLSREHRQRWAVLKCVEEAEVCRPSGRCGDHVFWHQLHGVVAVGFQLILGCRIVLVGNCSSDLVGQIGTIVERPRARRPSFRVQEGHPSLCVCVRLDMVPPLSNPLWVPVSKI